MSLFNSNFDVWVANQLTDDAPKSSYYFKLTFDELIFPKSTIAGLFPSFEVNKNRVEIPVGDSKFRPFRYVGKSNGGVGTGIGVRFTYKLEHAIRRNSDFYTLQLLRQVHYFCLYDIETIATTGTANFLDRELNLASEMSAINYEDDAIAFIYSGKHISFNQPRITQMNADGDPIIPPTVYDSNAIDLTSELNATTVGNGYYEKMVKARSILRTQAGSQALEQSVFVVSPEWEAELSLDLRFKAYTLASKQDAEDSALPGLSGYIQGIPVIVCDRLTQTHPDIGFILLNASRIEQYIWNKTKLQLKPMMNEAYPDGTYAMKFVSIYDYYLAYNTGEIYTGAYLYRTSQYGVDCDSAFYTFDVEKGGKFQLTAKGFAQGATLQWSLSGDTGSDISIDANGLVTVKANADLTAAFPQGYKFTATVSDGTNSGVINLEVSTFAKENL